MLDNLKYQLNFNSIDRNISDGEFEQAFEKLNFLINQEFKLSETFMKRAHLCRKLFMYEDAYSDYTYVINHCVGKEKAYLERLFLSFEMGNYYGVLSDCDNLLKIYENNDEILRLKFLSLIFTEHKKEALNLLKEKLDSKKYAILHLLFEETAKHLVKDEYAKSLAILSVIDLIDENNPIKLLKEANIYSICNNTVKEKELIEKINLNFPQYFVSHFKYKDMYEEMDLQEIYFLLELSIFDYSHLFEYAFKILDGYKNYKEGHITDAKETFESAIRLNPLKPEGYVILAQTLQIMSGYDKSNYIKEAENNYRTAMEIYQKEGQIYKVEDMKKEIMHINSQLNF